MTPSFTSRPSFFRMLVCFFWISMAVLVAVLAGLWFFRDRILRVVPASTFSEMLKDLSPVVASEKKEIAAVPSVAPIPGGPKTVQEYFEALDRYNNKPAVVSEFTLPELSDKFGDAVFKIEVLDKDGNKAFTGTAFAVSADGDLITNYHVVESGGRIVVHKKNGDTSNIKKVEAYNENDDLALIRLEGGTSSYLKLAQEEEKPAVVGARVAVIGGPLGLEGSLSEGIISSFRNLDEFEVPGEFIQITAPISPGSSGSPVFLMDGRVIGVATANLYGGQQLNFAVPVSQVKKLLTKRPMITKVQVTKYESTDPLEGDDPIYQDPEFRRARLLWLDEKYGSAESSFAPLMTKYPHSPVLHMYCGDILSRHEEHAKALAYMKTATKGLGKEAYPWNLYGQALERGGYIPQAIQALEYALSQDKELSEVASRLGKLYALKGNFPKSIEYYEEALKGKGPLRTWSLELARVHMSQKEWAKAYKVLEPYLETGNKNLVADSKSMRPSKGDKKGDTADLQVLNTARRCLTEQGLSTTELDESIGDVAKRIRKSAPSPTVSTPSNRNSQGPVAPIALLNTWKSGELSVTFTYGGSLTFSVGFERARAEWKLTSGNSGVIMENGNIVGYFSLRGDKNLVLILNAPNGDRVLYNLER